MVYFNIHQYYSDKSSMNVIHTATCKIVTFSHCWCHWAFGNEIIVIHKNKRTSTFSCFKLGNELIIIGKSCIVIFIFVSSILSAKKCRCDRFYLNDFWLHVCSIRNFKLQTSNFTVVYCNDAILQQQFIPYESNYNILSYYSSSSSLPFCMKD